MRFEKNTTVIKWLFESHFVYVTDRSGIKDVLNSKTAKKLLLTYDAAKKRFPLFCTQVSISLVSLYTSSYLNIFCLYCL